jgi:hypothetical protein
VKTFLIKNSEVRNDNPFKDGDDIPESVKPAAEDVRVPYNLALNQYYIPILLSRYKLTIL